MMEYKLSSVSSLNLRTARRGEMRGIEEPILFACSVMRKKLRLGKNASAMTRISYVLDGVEYGVTVGDCGIDLVVDLARYGPRVIHEMYRWERKSRVVRVSLVQGDMFCINCLGSADSHLFVKYDDLLVPGEMATYATKRICARCAITYLQMLLESEGLSGEKFPEMKVASYGG